MLAMVAFVTDEIAKLETLLPADQRTAPPAAAGPLPTMQQPLPEQQPPTEPQPLPEAQQQQPPIPAAAAVLLLTDGAQQADTAAAA